MNSEKLTHERVQSAIDRFWAQAAPDREEIDASAVRVLRNLEAQYETLPHPRMEPQETSWLRPQWLVAAAVAVLLAGGLMVLRLDNRTVGKREVGTITALNAGVTGDALRSDESYRVGDSGATVSLTDGSKVELSANSTFSVARRPDGMELGLKSGNVIVMAAKQKSGDLSVRTPHCTILVTGTVFSVRAEETGSRTTVYEGQVQVIQGDRSYNLGAGDRLSTSPVLSASALQTEIGWSRNAAAVLALLQGPEVVPVIPGQETIEGILENLTTGKPLANASIRVSQGDPAVAVAQSKTDADGRFKIGSIVPGAYQVIPSLDGFWAPDPPGTGVNFGPGQSAKNIRLRLVESATVSGRITDENGQPVHSRLVSLMRFQPGGVTQLTHDSEAKGGRTNQRGEYEFTRVLPGKYYVKLPGNVTYRVGVYYPGTANVDDAVAVDLRPGVVTTGIDFVMPAVESYAVGFTAPKSSLLWFDAVYKHETKRARAPFNAYVWQNGRTPSLRPPATPTVLEVMLQPTNRVRDPEAVIRNVVTLKDDEYLIPHVPPGRYHLNLLWKGEYERFPTVPLVVPQAEVAVDIEVIDRNVDLGTLTSKPRDLSVPVRITFENQLESDVTLRAISGEARNEVNSKSTERPLRLNYLAKGTYSVSVIDLLPDRYVSSMRYAGQDVLSKGLVLDGAGSGTLEVVIDGPGGSVEGTLRGVKGEAVSNARVVLVSPGGTGSRSLITDKDGMFRFSTLRPGEYRLYSWEFALPGADSDPEWRREYETRGTLVSVHRGQTAHAEVRLIPATR